MQKISYRFISVAVLSAACAIPGLAQPSSAAFGADSGGCASLPNYQALKAALVQAVATETSGLNNHMWATIVDRSGIVCAVAYSGSGTGSQWSGSRVISAQKANTADDYSLDGSAAATDPGGSGVFHGEPVFGGAAGRQSLRLPGKQSG